MDEEEQQAIFDQQFEPESTAAPEVIAEATPEVAPVEDIPESTPEPAAAPSEIELLKQQLLEMERAAQARERKLAGKIGEMNRKLLAANAQPVAPPDMSNVRALFDEDTANAIAADLAPRKPATNEAAQILADYEQSLVQDAISHVHPDWIDVARSPEFKDWVDSLDPIAQSEVWHSTDPDTNIRYLDTFKAHRDAISDPNFKQWQAAIGDTVPVQQHVTAYKLWQPVAQIEGFAEWANSLADPKLRSDIGRNTDPAFVAEAVEAYKEYKKSLVVAKRETQLAAAIMPKPVLGSNDHPLSQQALFEKQFEI